MTNHLSAAGAECAPNGDAKAVTSSVFEMAAQIFDGWLDTETGLRVLRIRPQAKDGIEGAKLPLLHTIYHQKPCFFDGGRRVLLRGRGRGSADCVMSLATAELESPFPAGYLPVEVWDATGTALLRTGRAGYLEFALYDMQTGEIVNSYCIPAGWTANEAHLLSDGRRVIVQQYMGNFYEERVRSQFYLLDANGCDKIFDADGFFCNHIQSCPTDAEMFAYDRWPSPQTPTEVIIHLGSLDGSYHEPLPQLENTVRPGPLWGGQRDHYVWTPDGNCIASYLAPDEVKGDNHFDFSWWLSILNWRTGEDWCVAYPDDRWGCHFQISPDSQWLVSAGRPGFGRLYRVHIPSLRNGWNEDILCTYPATLEDGSNDGPFHMPFVLPDQSGVIFTAGWPGAESGVYLVEWPRI